MPQGLFYFWKTNLDLSISAITFLKRFIALLHEWCSASTLRRRVFCHQKFPKVVFAVFCTAPCCLRFWNFREGNRKLLLQWFGAFWEFCVVSIQPIACVRKSHFRKQCFFFKTECCTVFNGTWINFYSSKIMKWVAGGKINFGLVPKARHVKYIFFAGLPWGFLTFFDQALLYFFILNFELRKISECIFENDRCILICTLISRDDKFKQRKIIWLNHVCKSSR